MSVEIEDTIQDDEVTRFVYLEDDRNGDALQIKLTYEGVILDAFSGDHHLGTRAMTYDEWFESIVGA